MSSDRRISEAKGRLLSLLRKSGEDAALRSALESDPAAVEAAEKKAKGRMKKTSDIDRAVAALKGAEYYSLDLETDGPTRAEATDPLRGRIVGVSFAMGFRPGEAWWFPFEGGTGPGEEPFSQVSVFRAFQPILMDPTKTVIGSNCKFDLMFLKANGVEVRNKVFDTVVADWMMNENNRRHGLKVLAKREFDVDLVEWTQAWASRDLVEGSKWAEYALNDARYVFKVWRDVHNKFFGLKGNERLGKLFHEVEMEIVRIFMEAEMEGVPIDIEYLGRLKERMEKQRDEAAERAFGILGRKFKITSSEEVSTILFGVPSEEALRGAMARREREKPKAAKKDLVEKMRGKDLLFETQKGILDIPLDRHGNSMLPGDNGFYSTDDGILTKYDHPLVSAILDFRSASQTLKFFVYAYIGGDPDHPKKIGCVREVEEGKVTLFKVYPDFHQAGTVAGRFTCSEPNLQQISGKKGLVKPMFIPPPGHKLVCGDFNQLQFRLAGHYAKRWFGRSNIADAYLAGLDLHTKTQQELHLLERRPAKTTNFGYIFGRHFKAFAAEHGVTIEEAKRFYDGFHKAYPEVRWGSDKCRRDICQKGYVESILGRRRNFPQHKGKDPDARERRGKGGGLWWDGWVAWNAVIQGAESDVVRVTMRNIHREIVERRKEDPRWETVKMLVQVHDEIMYQAPEEIAEDVKALMEDKGANSLQLAVPMILEVGIGDTWEEAKV